ncbi:MAG: sigma 54-interacting transcriptional regulator [Pseudomonadota bacterium]
MAKSSRPRILVIDDGLDYAQVVADQLDELELLQPAGADQPPRLASGPAALSYLNKHAAQVDVVLLDMRFDVDAAQLLPLAPGASDRRTRRFQGVAILREIRRLHPDLPVVLATSQADLSLVDEGGELASQSMTYLLDADDVDTLRIRIHQALEQRALQADDGEVLWGRDRAMHAVRRRLAVLARSSMPVLLEGETGTGKSFLAERVLHRQSTRRGPFVTLDLSTVPRDLVPAHLFGALRGAYTGAVSDRKGAFQLAHGGTLFLDEVQNVPLEVQKQLLVVLQERRVRPLGATAEQAVDVKVVAASNQPLELAVQAGTFRQDLYMRLGPAARVLVPPLRERPADLPALASTLVARAGEHPDHAPLKAEIARAAGLAATTPLRAQLGRSGGGRASSDEDLVLSLPDPVWSQLRRHAWPGNMRELAMVLHSMVSFTLVGAVDLLRSGQPLRSRRLQVDTGLVGELLRSAVRTPPAAPPGAPRSEGYTVLLQPGRTLNAVANDVERQYLSQLFRTCRGDFAAMAEVLLGSADRARAVRLRLNQVGLKVRELRGE